MQVTEALKQPEILMGEYERRLARSSSTDGVYTITPFKFKLERELVNGATHQSHRAAS